ncbi:MAG: TM1812 family CRISPR-associated protein [Clostridiales bacterium]|nr:TM1812 family CRISPR-associated protein [Clostridiales bacterium]
MEKEKNQKIILFLSTLRSTAKECDYTCPDKSVVKGTQTNDAPVKYLLKKYPNVSEILCLVTNAAKETAWDNFKKVVADTGSKAKCVEIKFEEGAPVQKILPDILTKTNGIDEILLEVTGGFRDTMMHLLLISRALSYKGIETPCAVYSSLQSHEVKDVTEILQVFDLIDGMQNLTSFGNVRKLRNYYDDRPHDDKITALLDAVDKLWQSITLCRSNLVPEQITAFNQALRDAKECSDPLLKALLPAFQKKFGEKMTIPSLIRWCAESDMIQQALTLYRERIPAYIMNERPDILTVDSDASPINLKSKAYKKFRFKYEWEARFHVHFLNMVNWENNSEDQEEEDYSVVLEKFEEAIENSEFSTEYTPERLRAIAMDFMYIHALRNMVNHADEQTLGKSTEKIDYLVKMGYKDPNNFINVEDIKNAIIDAVKRLEPQPQNS